VLIPVETLIDGCLRTLREDVMPDVGSRFARGRLYAAMDVLNNMRDRIEQKTSLLTTESDSAATALERIVRALRDAGHEPQARGIEEALASAPAAPPAERAAALRGALVAAIDALYGLPSEMPEAARLALADHLGPQAVRDIATLKPSLLNEISKG
jgi:hypothetical protein